jgi:hypothetical protein
MREQPSLLDLPDVRQKVHKRVRPTSRAQYAVAREQFTGRRAHVLRFLAAFWNHWNDSPTSAELADYVALDAASPFGKTDRLLYVRRGLSDLQLTNDVQAAGKRVCRISGKVCMTWRVTPR